MENNELYHWGIKGMKWGVRRYQNEDGTLTEEGKNRYSRDIRENNAKKKENRIIINGPDPNRWVKEDLNRRKKVADSATDVMRKTDDLSRSLPRKKETIDLSNMTDTELKQFINRKQLEQQYLNYYTPQQALKGKTFVKDAFEVVGSTVALASSVIALALAIKELKG